MLSYLRTFAKSWVAKILLLVLMVGFGFWGIQGALVPKISTDVVTAGQRSKNENQFRDLVDRQMTRIREQGQSITMDQLVKAGAPQEWAKQLGDEMAFGAWMEKAGIRPDQSLTVDGLRTIPNLREAFNPVTGVFDQTTFRAILSQNHIDEADFLQGIHDDIAEHQLIQAVQASAKAPRFYSALTAVYALQSRDATYFLLDPRALGPLPTPTDADLQKFYKEIAQPIPESRALTVVLFDPRAVEGSITVDPAQVKKMFDFRKDTYAVPERRTFAEITAKDAAGAAKAAAALRSGATPDVAAKAAGAQATTRTDLAKTAIPDTKIADAVYGMKPGEVSAPIRSDAGFSVVQLQSVSAGHQATFDEKKSEIEAELKDRAAQDKVQDMVQKYSEAKDSGASAADAAAKVGAVVKDLPLMTAQGQTVSGEPIRTDSEAMQKILSTGFGLPKGGQSDTQKLVGNVYFAVAVKELKPSYTPKLDEVRAQVAQAWTQRAAATALKAKGDELVNRLKKGEPMAQVAASVHAQVEQAADLKRPTEQPRDIKSAVNALVFTQPKGQFFAERLGPVLAIGEVTAIHPPATVTAAEIAAHQEQAQQDRLTVQSLLTQLQSTAVQKINPKINQANLTAAVGVGTDQGQAPGAPPQ